MFIHSECILVSIMRYLTHVVVVSMCEWQSEQMGYIVLNSNQALVTGGRDCPTEFFCAISLSFLCVVERQNDVFIDDPSYFDCM